MRSPVSPRIRIEVDPSENTAISARESNNARGPAVALPRAMHLRTKAIVAMSALLTLVFAGCSATPIEEVEPEGEISAEIQQRCAQLVAGPCAGTPIDAAVRCAQSHGARLLSYYRSVEEQECVRRQNGCDNRCTGNAGCRILTASCTGSPHTQCRAVDFVADGAPATTAQLRACGLAKIARSAHANHYDYVGGATSNATGSTTSSGGSSGSSGKGGSTTGSSSSSSSGSSGKGGTGSSSSGKSGGGDGDDGRDDDDGKGGGGK